MVRTIEVVPYDSSWPLRFEEEVRVIRPILGDELLEIHHVGSTSIPGISAKPIIDILPVVSDINRVDDFNQQFIRETEEQYSYLKREGICSYIFSAVLDSEGEVNGIPLLYTVLTGLKKEKRTACSEQVLSELKSFLNSVKTKGFLPKNLFFAIKRFHRWFGVCLRDNRL